MFEPDCTNIEHLYFGMSVSDTMQFHGRDVSCCIPSQKFRQKFPLVFIHGFNCAPTMYEKFLDILSLDFAVYTLDLPGVNKSAAVDACLYTTDAYVECIG